MTPSHHPQAPPHSSGGPGLPLPPQASGAPPFFFPFSSLPSYANPQSAPQPSSTVESSSSSYQSNHSNAVPFPYSRGGHQPMVAASSYSPTMASGPPGSQYSDRSPAPHPTGLQMQSFNELAIQNLGRLPLHFNAQQAANAQQQSHQSLQQAIHAAQLQQHHAAQQQQAQAQAQAHAQQAQQAQQAAQQAQAQMFPQSSFALPLHASASAAAPVTATATVHSSLPIHTRPTVAANAAERKGGDKRKLHQESTASLRRKKHKEVEIKRRKKINSLFSDLTSELECGPTDKASILLYALTFIRTVKKKYPTIDMPLSTGTAAAAAEAVVKREADAGGEGEGDDEGGDGDDDEEGDEETPTKTDAEAVPAVKAKVEDDMESRKTSDSSAASSPASLATIIASKLSVDSAASASTSSLSSSSAASPDL